jgi:hypothetical protein
MASDGFRFLWFVDSQQVVYSLKGTFYVQSAQGFINEVRTAPWVDGLRRAEFMAKIAEIEMKLLMGILAGSSGAGFVIVVGTEVAEFLVEHRDDFGRWQSQLSAVLRARQFLKQQAPTIYDKLFSAVCHQLYRDIKSKIPDAVTPEIIAFGVGVVIGTVGKKLSTGKFSVLALVFVVCQQLVVRLGLSVLPGAFELTADEYKKLAAEIMEKMRQAGVDIRDIDARQIIQEAQQHPREIKQAFELLKEAFQNH